MHRLRNRVLQGLQNEAIGPKDSVIPITAGSLTVSVIVTTYRRVERLAACLAGLRAQTRSADEVVVVVHTSDTASTKMVSELARTWPQLRFERVEPYGSVAALNRGLAVVRKTVVAITDDDAVPRADWLERIVQTYERDRTIAAVGGRDVVVLNGRVVVAPPRRFLGRAEKPRDVGRIQWFGRMIANHHIGTGDARDVDVLKGVNSSFRMSAVIGHGYDVRLRGTGAVVHSELSICLPLRRRGLRILYDPDIVVMHYPSIRPRGDRRGNRDREAISDAAHNETLEILDYFGPVRRFMFVAFCLAIGTTDAPGLAVLARDILRGHSAAWTKFSAAQRGRAAALVTRRTPRPRGS